jgi:hypothetical protein
MEPHDSVASYPYQGDTFQTKYSLNTWTVYFTATSDIGIGFYLGVSCGVAFIQSEYTHEGLIDQSSGFRAQGLGLRV